MLERELSGATSTTRQDDRTPEQRRTHTILITATDRALSGWGGARGGLSKCAWAVAPDQSWERVFNWVKRRGDMSYVNMTTGKWYPRAAHVHIYVVNAGHPALA